MAGSDREPFAEAVAARLGEPRVDYVRLEISATCGGEVQGRLNRLSGGGRPETGVTVPGRVQRC